MDEFEINGGRRLKGLVRISGSKNAALPCLFATLLTDETCVLEEVPQLDDIDTAIRLLTTLGKKVRVTGNRVVVAKGKPLTGQAPYELVRRMRASILVMGPLLARKKKAQVSLPGGCAIGARPVNFHLDGFERMGVRIGIKEGYVDASVGTMKGCLIPLAYPSVGATENLLMGAVLAKGVTIIQNAAREPEIVDLGRMLQSMGASIQGLETSEITVQGVKALSGTTHRIIPDRIETGTFLIASAITRGDVTLQNADLSHLGRIVTSLKRSGLVITENDGAVRARWARPLKPVSVSTDVYPGFPTDMQAQWITLMSLTRGRCHVRENVFENRFLHVQELLRFGADIRLKGRDAMINGVSRLSGCKVMVSDLRAGAALVLAGLAARGRTTVLRVYHLDRGYEKLEIKLRKLGARIKRKSRNN